MAKDRPTLSDLFSPPDDELQGIGGILCGFSADMEFLNHALMRFTRATAASRMARGSVDWTLMLDPPHAMLPVENIPGLIQLRPNERSQRKPAFDCLHAKVALLAFGTARMGDPSTYRLIISTGNWTVASARTMIEMVWYLDIDLNAKSEAEILESEITADLNELWAVAHFFKSLLSVYQSGAELTVRAQYLIEHAIKSARTPDNHLKLRFLSSLPTDLASKSEALLDQIVNRLDGVVADCNYLVCGSGFFEQANGTDNTPAVLSAISKKLVEKSITTKVPQKLVIANPNLKDQLITSFNANTLKDWTLHKPNDPSTGEKANRLFNHSKFLFLAKSRNESFSGGGTIYLGSGNLSQLGFTEALPIGNIEAGVLLECREVDSVSKLKRSIPLGRAYANVLIEENEFVDDEEAQRLDRVSLKPSPVLVFTSSLGITAVEGFLMRVVWDHSIAFTGNLEVIQGSGERSILPNHEETFLFVNGELPRFIEIEWEGTTAKIPCLDSTGAFRRQSIAHANFGSWLDQLLGFPATWTDPASDDEDRPEDDEASLNAATSAVYGESIHSREFPAHTAMMLVEAIAQQNERIAEDQAADWLFYLRQMLIENKPSEKIKQWNALGVNFFEVLKSREGFAPPWLNLAAYDQLIDEIMIDWELASQCRLALSI